MINTAKKLFDLKEYKVAGALFEELKMPYETGLCLLLTRQQDAAKKVWQEVKDPCTATKWGLIVLDLINLRHNSNLKFFQTRAFLEVYLNLFIQNNLIDYAENLISACKIFAQKNYESHKFIARVLFANNYIDQSLDFIQKSRNICYPDPEGILIEAQCYFKKKMFVQSLNSLKELFQFVPDYLPALALKNEILGLGEHS